MLVVISTEEELNLQGRAEHSRVVGHLAALLAQALAAGSAHGVGHPLTVVRQLQRLLVRGAKQLQQLGIFATLRPARDGQPEV